jgi:glycosyltransferase involved in cell wall biosynthesis
MKILVVQDYLRSGGTERQSILLAGAFRGAGHGVQLLTFRPGGPLARTVPARVPRRSLQPFDLGLDWFAPRLINAVRSFDPDVVLGMGRMANCWMGGVQQTFPDVAVVGTMRTGKKLPRLFRRSLQRVRHVVANSREARDVLVARHGVPTDKITVIHNSLVFPDAVLGGTAGIQRDTLRAEHGATARTTVLLCVAMFRPEKNQRELVEIAAALPPERDWQLWLAGDGPARAGCERLVAEKGLGERVKFLGFQRDPSALYGAGDIAVHASWSESLSNFLIEAQAHGLPIVAYQAQGIGESCLPHRTGWVIPRDDRAAFRAQLLALMNENSATRNARAADARKFARTTFDPERQVAAYLDLFTRLV